MPRMTPRLLLLPAFALLSALASPTGFAQTQSPPMFYFQQYVQAPEGDQGLTDVTIEWRLYYAPAGFASGFTVWTEELSTPQAIAGRDYVTLPPTNILVAPGQTSGTFTIQIIGDQEIENNEIFSVNYSNFLNGAVTENGSSTYNSGVHIISNDTEPVPPLTGNDDHVPFVMNSDGVSIEPERNDISDPELLRDGTLTLTSQPQHGELEVTDRTNDIDDLWYRPEPDFSGRDEFGYRLCKPDGDCVQAKVILQGQLKEPAFSGHNGRMNSERWELANLPALADARYLTSTLAEPRDLSLVTTVDTTPHVTWDSRAGMDWVATTIPASADGQPVEFRVHAVSLEDYQSKVDLLVGIDADGDGAPSVDEQRCFAGNAQAINVANLRCELPLLVGAEPVTYWVAVHSREATPQMPRLQVFQARMDVNDGSLIATGPATTERLESLWTVVSWRDLTAAHGDVRMGYVRIVDGDDVIGDFRIDVMGGGAFLMLPQDGTPVTLDMTDSATAWWPDRQIFFDIPAGATSVTLTAKSDQPVDFQLGSFGFPDPREPALVEGPTIPEADWIVTVPGQARSTTINNPRMGRWYAVVRNPANQQVRVELSVSVQGNHPAIRPGSYFNTSQPGSGVLLYPAADQWAGLWYTYGAYGRPTWYYLQAPKPGANGIWRSPVLRSAWNGTSSYLTQVGELSIVPTSVGTDTFLMSYTIDGHSGSQAMSPLGRGCPTLQGLPIDISSHWFDPVRAGTGYSVQMWENYEFFAAFMYDRRGEPTFFVAESPVFGGAEADLPLEVLRGSCPLCSYISKPTRQPAGILRRIIDSGTLTEIQLDVDYPELPPLEGQRAWTVTDQVQTLGGPGTTQGCDL